MSLKYEPSSEPLHISNPNHHTRRLPLTPRQNTGALDSARSSARKAGALLSSQEFSDTQVFEPQMPQRHTRRLPLTPRGGALDSARSSARKAGALPLSVRGERGGSTPRPSGTPGGDCFTVPISILYLFYSAYIHAPAKRARGAGRDHPSNFWHLGRWLFYSVYIHLIYFYSAYNHFCLFYSAYIHFIACQNAVSCFHLV